MSRHVLINGTVAENLQFSYNPSHPPRLFISGISVYRIFIDPDGQTLTQPSFLYQDYDYPKIFIILL